MSNRNPFIITGVGVVFVVLIVVLIIFTSSRSPDSSSKNTKFIPVPPPDIQLPPPVKKCKKKECVYSDTIDAIYYDCKLIELLKDCTIKYCKKIITNNIKLKQIDVYNGYIYGLGQNGLLYLLNDYDLDLNEWEWTLVEWAPIEIEYMNITLNCEYLWLQNNDFVGNLYYDEKLISTEEIEPYTYKVYGSNINDFLYVNIGNNTLTYKDDIIDNILWGALDNCNNVVTTRKNNNRVKIVNWVPMYFNSIIY